MSRWNVAGALQSPCCIVWLTNVPQTLFSTHLWIPCVFVHMHLKYWSLIDISLKLHCDVFALGRGKGSRLSLYYHCVCVHRWRCEVSHCPSWRCKALVLLERCLSLPTIQHFYMSGSCWSTGSLETQGIMVCGNYTAYSHLWWESCDLPPVREVSAMEHQLGCQLLPPPLLTKFREIFISLL